MRPDVVVVGNCVAGLVASRALAQLGKSVMTISPSASWGGHFGAHRIGDHRFDLGMVALEFTSFNEESSPDVLTYRADLRGDCGRFVGLVHDYVEELAPISEVPSPKVMMRSRIYDDMIIANGFDALKALTDSEAQTAYDELTLSVGAGRDHPYHASHKLLTDVFERETFDTVSRHNHGATLHRLFFEDFQRKILGSAATRMMARYHRASWLPLYWPETLQSQWSSQPQRLPRTEFHYPKAGYVGAIVDALLDDVRSNPNIIHVKAAVERVRRANGAWSVLLGSQSEVVARDLIWASSHEHLLLAAGVASSTTYDRCSISLVFLTIPAAALSTLFGILHVLEPSVAMYRITNLDVCAGSYAEECRLVVELPAQEDLRPSDSDTLARMVVGDLGRTGLLTSPGGVQIHAVRTLKGVLMSPCRSNLELFTAEKLRLKQLCPDLEVIGPHAGFLAGSLNDQVIQGLRIAALTQPGRR